MLQLHKHKLELPVPLLSKVHGSADIVPALLSATLATSGGSDCVPLLAPGVLYPCASRMAPL